MRAMILKNFSHIGVGRFISLFIGCIVFALSGRVSSKLTYEQYCLSILTDHYYILYFAIPLFLFICFSVIEDDSEVVILRYGSYFRYFLSKSVSLAVIATVFMLIQLCVIGVSGIGLPLGDSWSMPENLPTSELFAVLKATIFSPLICFAVSAIYMFFGLSLTGVICQWIGHFLPKSISIKLLITLYVITQCSIKIRFIYRLPITLFNHLIILHHNLTSEYRFSITLITAAVIVATILITVKRCWNSSVNFRNVVPKGLTVYYCKLIFSTKHLFIMVATIFLVVVLKYLQSGGGITPEEWVIGFFAGHGIGTFRVINFLEMLISNGLPLYMLAIFVERITSSHSDFITIRLKRRIEMLWGILKTAALFILMYGVCLVLILTAVISIFGLQISNDTFMLLISVASIKLLDIAVQFLLLTAIYCITGQVTAGFIAIVGINLLCVLPGQIVRYLPFGLSSMSRLSFSGQTYGIPFSAAYGVLLATGCLIFGWLRLWGYKKLLKI